MKYNGTIEQWLAISGLENLMRYGSNKKLYIGESELTELVIPNSVKSIGSYAFSGCSSLTSITIPDSVKSIGSYAFSGCSSLTSITIPDSVKSIGYEAFRGCSSLTSVTIPDSVTSIGGYAFENCSSLTSVTIPDSITSIDDSAFYNCFALAEVYNLSSLNITKGSKDNGYVAYYARDVYNSLIEPSKLTEKDGMILHADGDNVTLIRYIGDATSVIIPDSVTSLGDGAFYKCSNLTSVTIGNNVANIGLSTFYGCSSLTNITIPDSVTSIGDGAFFECYVLVEVYNMSNLNIIKGSTDYGYVAYYARDVYNSLLEPSKLTEKDGMILHTDDNNVTLVKYIGDATTVIIPDSVTSIGYRAFEGCSSLTSVTIGSGVTSIDSLAFYNCASLTSVTIGNSVTSIGDYAFYGCSSLTSVTFENTSGWFVSKSNDATSGTDITVIDPSQNAKYLKATYYNYYWKRG